MNAEEVTVDSAGAKTLRFLRAVGFHPPISSRLREFGYDQAEHARGWELLTRASCHPSGPSPRDIARATKRLADWRAKGCVRLRVILAVLHPEAEARVFSGVDVASESEERLARSVALILDRLEALEREHGDAIGTPVGTMSACGEDRRHRQLLRADVNTALGIERDAESAALRRPAEEALRLWYEEWSTIASVVIEKRGHLIRLGLAKPRSVA